MITNPTSDSCKHRLAGLEQLVLFPDALGVFSPPPATCQLLETSPGPEEHPDAGEQAIKAGQLPLFG